MHRRIPLRAKARMEFKAERFFLSETTVDLSAGGAFVATESRLEPGSRCRFEIALTDRGPVVEGTGEVTHVRAAEDGPAGIGIRFSTLDEEGAALLDELAEVYHREGADAMESALETAASNRAPALRDTQRMTPLRPEDETPEEDVDEADPPAVDELDDTAPIPPISVPGPEDPGVSESEEEPEQTTMIDTTEFRREHGGEEVLPEQEPELHVEPAPEGEPASPEEGPDPDPVPVADPPADDDPLSKTLDVARDRHDLPRSRAPRRSRLGLLVWSSILLVLLVGAWLFWRHRADFQWPGLLASRELAGWEGEDPYVVAEVERSAGEAERRSEELAPPETAARDRAGAAEPAGISGDRPDPEVRFRSVREIRWEEDEEGLWVFLVLDGEIPPEEYGVFRPPEGPPRQVVQLFGVDHPYPAPELEVGSPLVAKIRTGFHEVEGTREQRVVLDLVRADVEVDRIEADGATLRLLLVAGDGEPGERAEPVSVETPEAHRSSSASASASSGSASARRSISSEPS